MSRLRPLKGSSIAQIRRIFYEFKGVLDDSFGGLEITTSQGDVFYLDCAGDGERLSVSRTAWEDPFQGPLSAENQAYVDEFGKAAAVDVSAVEPYSALLGETVGDVLAIVRGDGSRRADVGAVLLTNTNYVCAFAEADEFFVSVVCQVQWN